MDTEAALRRRPPPTRGPLVLAQAWCVLEARALAALRTWQSAAVSALLNPLLYLLGIGLGVGAIVAPGAADALPGGSYLAFVAPALLVATGMQIAAVESMWPVMVGIEWHKTYHAAAATPLRPVDIMLGHLGFGLVRVVLSGLVIAALIVALLDGASPSGTVLAIGVAVAVGGAFSAPILWLTARIRSHAFLTGLLRFGLVPLFLFSGTFFPVARLPQALQPVATLSPLWHGAELARAAVLGTPTAWPAAGHIAVLLALAAVGAVLAERALRAVLHE